MPSTPESPSQAINSPSYLDDGVQPSVPPAAHFDGRQASRRKLVFALGNIFIVETFVASLVTNTSS
jgi:hypothetical protein